MHNINVKVKSKCHDVITYLESIFFTFILLLGLISAIKLPASGHNLKEQSTMSNVPENAPQRKLLFQGYQFRYLFASRVLMKFTCLCVDCPGTQSQDAGKASACAGCPNQNLCASGKQKYIIEITTKVNMYINL